MRTRTVQLMIAMVALVILVACGGESNPPPGDGIQPPPNNVVIPPDNTPPVNQTTDAGVAMMPPAPDSGVVTTDRGPCEILCKSIEGKWWDKDEIYCHNAMTITCSRMDQPGMCRAMTTGEDALIRNGVVTGSQLPLTGQHPNGNGMYIMNMSAPDNLTLRIDRDVNPVPPIEYTRMAPAGC